MKRIINFGSINIDHVYQVEHFVQGGETLAAVSLSHYYGGKGMNQSIALARAGAMVFHSGKVGQDGVPLVNAMRETGVDVSHIYTDGTITGHTIIQIDPHGQNGILLYKGANSEITPREVNETLRHFGRGDVLLVQNEASELALMMRAAAERDMEIAINPSPIGPELMKCPLHLVSWFLLNEIEGNALTGETDPDAIIQKLLEQYPQARVVLTLGEVGVLYADASQRLSHGIYRVPVVDTTAAGDTFTGYFLAQMAANSPIPEALRLASIASSIAVSRAGAVSSIPTFEEVVRVNLSRA